MRTVEPTGVVSGGHSQAMTVAVVRYLQHRRDEVGDSREDILRLAGRAEFDGHPPEPVADWLDAEGVVL